MASFSDDFDRANVSDIDGTEATIAGVGQGWHWERVNVSGSCTIGISSNFAYLRTFTGDGQSLYLTPEIGSDDQKIEWASNASSDSGRFTGCILRCNGTDAYVWLSDLGSSTVYKLVGGVFTALKSMSFGDGGFPAGSICRVSIVGSLITAELYNSTGTTLVASDTVTDTSITSGKRVGIPAIGASDTTRGWQWFEATGLASASRLLMLRRKAALR